MRSPRGTLLRLRRLQVHHDRLLPCGIGSAGEVWLHSGSSAAWYAARKMEAIAALGTMGIGAPPNFPDDFVKDGSA